MADYFQLGSDLQKPPYSGCDSNAVNYSGQHKTVALPAAVAEGDTVEIPLFEIPAGARIHNLKWAIEANLGTNATAKLVLRKKSNIINPSTTIAGNDGASSGTAASAPDKVIQVNGADSFVMVTSANNSQAVIIPETFEGLATPKNELQEPYYLGIKIIFGATPTWVAGKRIFVAASGEFIGTL
ncbi:hypothetical protein [Methylomicrobium agile]|uniref:hypothetical protein n=1 Tax=Methylomicrobium agile TaxID=39774 RepID=UPI0004DFAB7E|nr:hypothetical protein [Methylomicrobium agile]